MNKQLFEFEWNVPLKGFEWVTGRGDKPGESGQYLCEPSVKAGENPEFRCYAPLAPDYNGLFRTLAATDPTPEGIKGFADKFGHLVSLQPVPSPNGTNQRLGERLENWQHYILRLKFALTLWELTRSGKRKALSQYVSWVAKDLVICASAPHLFKTRPGDRLGLGESYWPFNASSDLFDKLTFGDVLRPAVYSLQSAINEQIQNCSPRLLWSRSRARQELCIVPFHLLSAIWLQFAQAVDGATNHRQCPKCDRWFEVAPGRGRTDKEYCSVKCRMRAYRDRAI